MTLSPITVKRLKAFRRMRRAWWAFLAFCGVFLFCLAADWVCPCDPQAVVDPKTLEPFRRPVVERTYGAAAARFSYLDSGEIVDYEGPDGLCPRLAALKGVGSEALAGKLGCFDGYCVRIRRHGDYTRVFLSPERREPVTERSVGLEEVSFPFRPCPGHPFGIDAGGRDVYARVVHGLRIALLFGIVLALTGLAAGVVAGAVEGYFGGKTDLLLQRLTEIWSAMPFLYVMIFVGSTVGRSFGLLLACYAAFNWITVSYYVRAEFLRLRGQTFVDAARVQGYSPARIIFRHILPNALTPLITLFPFLLMGAIGSLAALDFLGFGLPPMTPSCGELLNQAQQFRSAWWLVVFPSAALFIVMLLAVLVGEGLRDAFDPRQRTRYE